jgi:hypothetical protein
MHRSITPRSRSMLLAAGLALAVVTLAACGGGSSSGGSTQQSSAAAGNGAGPAAGANAPAASGLIADVSGSTMQVQSQQSGQVAVSWSTATSFTDTVPTTVSAVKTGDCVFATGPSGSSASATTLTAATVSVSPPVNGTCGAAGRGGGQGQGTRPARSGFPSGGARPSGVPGGGAGSAVANGSVTSVSGSTIVIASQAAGSNPTSRTVTLGGSTTITTVADATASAVKVGKCATVQGDAASSGTVAATTVRITDPVDGQCGGRFGAGANGG